MPPARPRRYVVIGAGVLGASVAARLADAAAAAGAGPHVTLLDQGQPGRAASRWSFAWLNSNDKGPRHYHDLNHAGLRAWAELAPDLDGAAWYRPVGHVELATSDAGRAELAVRVRRLTEWGYPARLIGMAEAAEIEPSLRPAGPETTAAFFPGEGYLLTEPLISRLVRHATSHGADLVTGDRGRVVGLDIAPGTVPRVRTSAGPVIEADEVVCCAGRWVPGLAAMAGAACPVPLISWDTPGATAPGLVVRVGPVGPAGPARVLHTPEISLRPHPGELLQLEAPDAAVDLHTPATRLRRWAAELLGRARRTVRGLDDAGVVTYQVCVRPMPADERSIVGRLPGCEALYVAVTHSGVTLAAHLSRLIAAELTSGVPHAGLAPYRPDRFLGRESAADRPLSCGAHGCFVARRPVVGYWLRMSDEIHDWLTDLRRSDPKTARLVGQALAALMTEGASLGSPLVAPVASPGPEELPGALELAYQDRLERLLVAGRRAAEATVLVMDIRNEIAELESAQVKLDDQRRRALAEGGPDEAAPAEEKLAAVQRKTDEARKLLPRALEAQRELAGRHQLLQARTDAFRTRKEVLKASYTAARADLLVDEAVAASGQDGDDGDGQQQDPGQAAAALRDATAEIERELRLAPWPEGLMELRPGAPGAPGALGDSQVRIIFAVEPAGTALLISVLEGREAVLDHYQEAIIGSADVLRQVRAGQAPEAALLGYDDTRSFLDEFYPGDAGQAVVAAVALAERNRGRTLAEQRLQLGLTQAEVAQRMGVPQERVSAIEHAEPGATDVRTLAAYVAALGGRLEVTAEFGAERVQLR